GGGGGAGDPGGDGVGGGEGGGRDGRRDRRRGGAASALPRRPRAGDGAGHRALPAPRGARRRQPPHRHVPRGLTGLAPRLIPAAGGTDIAVPQRAHGVGLLRERGDELVPQLGRRDDPEGVAGDEAPPGGGGLAGGGRPPPG